MMQRTVTVLTLTLLVAGCGQSSAPAAPRPTIKVQGPEQKQLAAASDMDRAIALKRAIYDAGSSCKRVISTGFVTDYKNMSMWQAGCDDGAEWAVFVAPDGSIQVRPCADLTVLKLPECTLASGKATATKRAAT